MFDQFQIRIQNEAMKKQSAIFLTNSMPSQQFQDALMQVEKLTSQLQEQKQEAQKQVGKYDMMMKSHITATGSKTGGTETGSKI